MRWPSSFPRKQALYRWRARAASLGAWTGSVYEPFCRHSTNHVACSIAGRDHAKLAFKVGIGIVGPRAGRIGLGDRGARGLPAGALLAADSDQSFGAAGESDRLWRSS